MVTDRISRLMAREYKAYEQVTSLKSALKHHRFHNALQRRNLQARLTKAERAYKALYAELLKDGEAAPYSLYQKHKATRKNGFDVVVELSLDGFSFSNPPPPIPNSAVVWVRAHISENHTGSFGIPQTHELIHVTYAYSTVYTPMDHVSKSGRDHYMVSNPLTVTRQFQAPDSGSTKHNFFVYVDAYEPIESDLASITREPAVPIDGPTGGGGGGGSDPGTGGGGGGGGGSGGSGGFGSGSTTSSYGAMGTDTKANLRVGDAPGGGTRRVSYRFKASVSSPITDVRFEQRGGTGYSSQNGNGGSMTVQIMGDNGAGLPDEVAVASVNYSPSNPTGTWATYDSVHFGSPFTATAGTHYHVVFTRTGSSANYISVNEVFIYGGDLVPRQPFISDDDLAVLTANDGATWGIEGQFTPVVDIVYGSGARDGQAYIGNLIANYGVISGASDMVREHFTVTGSSVTVDSIAVRVRRDHGTADLILTLQDGSDNTIEAVTVDHNLVPISSAGGDTGGSVWVKVNFSSPHVLAVGSTYSLRLSCAGGTEYTMACILQGDSVGFGSFAFRDGSGQFTTNGGSSWANLYAFDDVDIEFSFHKV